MLVDDEAHLVRPEDLDAKHDRSTLLRLEDSCLLGWDVQHALVTGRVADEWNVHACRQVLVQLYELILQDLGLLRF